MFTGQGSLQNVIVWTLLTGLKGLSKSATKTAVKLPHPRMSGYGSQGLQLLLNSQTKVAA